MASHACQQISLLTSEQIDIFLNSFDTVLTDCDGVLWTGPSVIDGSVEVIQAFRALGKKVIFVTNNGTKSRNDYLTKFTRLGYGGNTEDIFTSSYLCALYLQQQNFARKVYVFGPRGITDELDAVGIRHTGSEPDYSNTIQFSTAHQGLTVKGLKPPDPDIGAVIVSFTNDLPFDLPRVTEIVHYLNQKVRSDGSAKLAASQTEQLKPMPFIVSDPDPIIPALILETQEHIKVPGTGTFVAAIEAAVQRSPIILGKPNKFVFEAIKSVHRDIQAERTIMIGDNPETDIFLGNQCGLKTLMVGTGVGSFLDVCTWETLTSLSALDQHKQKCIPNYYIDRLGNILEHIKSVLGKTDFS